jgi:hypothetical protein
MYHIKAHPMSSFIYSLAEKSKTADLVDKGILCWLKVLEKKIAYIMYADLLAVIDIFRQRFSVP